MKQRVHILRVIGRSIVRDDQRIAMVSGSSGVEAVRLVIENPEDWAGLSLGLVFDGSGTRTYVSWDGSSDVGVPAECLREEGWLFVTLVGTKGADAKAITENMVRGIRVVAHGPDCGYGIGARDGDTQPSDEPSSGGTTPTDADAETEDAPITEGDIRDLFGL